MIERKRNKGASTLAPPFVGGYGQRQRSIMHGIIDCILGSDWCVVGVKHICAIPNPSLHYKVPECPCSSSLWWHFLIAFQY